MKELSIKEKAKAYDEIIEKANKMHHENCEACQMCIEELIPELKESEDERMRNAAINACKYMVDNFENSTKQYEDAIAWLEKHGEHAKFLDSIQVGDKVTRNEDGVLVNLSQLKRVAKSADVGDSEKQGGQKQELLTKEKTLKNSPFVKQELAWSKEDEVKINRIVACLENLNVADNDILLKDVDWLKSLKPQNRWKPSDEQLMYLSEAIDVVTRAEKFSIVTSLKELRKQLKKLRKE